MAHEICQYSSALKALQIFGVQPWSAYNQFISLRRGRQSSPSSSYYTPDIMTPPYSPSPSPDDTWQTKEVLQQAKHDLQSHVSDVKAAASRTLDEVRSTAVSTAAAARDGCQAVRHDATLQFRSYQEEIEHTIRQQPLKAVGLAALTGLFIGLLSRK